MVTVTGPEEVVLDEVVEVEEVAVGITVVVLELPDVSWPVVVVDVLLVVEFALPPLPPLVVEVVMTAPPEVTDDESVVVEVLASRGTMWFAAGSGADGFLSELRCSVISGWSRSTRQEGRSGAKREGILALMLSTP